MKNLAVNLIVTISAVLVTLGALEIGFRIFVPEQFSTPLVHVRDTDLGLRQLPGARGQIRTPEFVTEVVINSKGLRDKEYPYRKPPGTRRILCLGDSFTFGYGVEADRTFAKVLERALNSDGASDGAWEVINAGVPGTGTAHQLAYFDLEGHKYAPDFVLLSFCGKNDFEDNLRFGIYSLEDGKLTRHAARLSPLGKVRRAMEKVPGYRTVMTRSRLLMFAGHSLTSWIYARRASGPADPAATEARRREAYQLTRSLILGLRDSCLAGGSKLVITVTPEIDRGDTRAEVVELVAQMRAEGIEYVDLRSAFDRRAGSATDLFFAVDHHWNTSGHQVAAETLYDYFLGTAARQPISQQGGGAAPHDCP